MTANEAAMNKLLLNKVRKLKIDQKLEAEMSRVPVAANNIF